MQKSFKDAHTCIYSKFSPLKSPGAASGQSLCMWDDGSASAAAAKGEMGNVFHVNPQH